MNRLWVGSLVFVLLSSSVAAQIVIIDPAKNARQVSSAAQKALDAANQQEKLASGATLENIEREQVAAFEKFLGNVTGSFDVNALENGGADFPNAQQTYTDADDSAAGIIFDPKKRSIEQMIIETADRYKNHAGVRSVGLSPLQWRLLFQSMIKQESAFNPTAQSHVGAYGFAQLMPATAAELGVNPRDPRENLDGGARYLAARIGEFNSIELGLAAYNAGAGNVRKYGGIPPFKETQNYVRKILANYNSYAASVGSVEQIGTIEPRLLASGEAALMASFNGKYIGEIGNSMEGAMARTAAALKMETPDDDSKAALDRNSYIKAERARILTLLLRQRAAKTKTLAAEGISFAQERLAEIEFGRN